MKVIISTSAVAATEAEKRLINKATWYTYSGKKIKLEDGHKDYDIDIVKGDKIGSFQTPSQSYLLHEDDPSIKFKIGKAQEATILASSTPFSGKIKGVVVKSTAPKPVVEEKPAPKSPVKKPVEVKPAPVKETIKVSTPPRTTAGKYFKSPSEHFEHIDRYIRTVVLDSRTMDFLHKTFSQLNYANSILRRLETTVIKALNQGKESFNMPLVNSIRDAENAFIGEVQYPVYRNVRETYPNMNINSDSMRGREGFFQFRQAVLDSKELVIGSAQHSIVNRVGELLGISGMIEEYVKENKEDISHKFVEVNRKLGPANPDDLELDKFPMILNWVHNITKDIGPGGLAILKHCFSVMKNGILEGVIKNKDFVELKSSSRYFEKMLDDYGRRAGYGFDAVPKNVTGIPKFLREIEKVKNKSENHFHLYLFLKEYDYLLTIKSVLKNMAVKRGQPGNDAKKVDPKDHLKKTCSCCFWRVMPKGERGMAHHGYQRPGSGWQTASCPGIRFPQLEISTEGTEWMVGYFTEMMVKAQKQLKDAEQGKIKEISVFNNRTGKHNKIDKTHPDWKLGLVDYMHDLKRNISSFKGSIAELNAVIKKYSKTKN